MMIAVANRLSSVVWAVWAKDDPYTITLAA
jgi:hypothetical protein